MICWKEPYTLIFKRPAGTSRGVLNIKKTYFIYLNKANNTLVGEANMFSGLSYDDVPDYEKYLDNACREIELGKFDWENWREFPSIQFGIEQILLQQEKGAFTFFESNFQKGINGIEINGLIWMGDIDFILSQIEDKLKSGYRCIKLKIGANWEEEEKILINLRERFSADKLELRVDANGGFSFDESIEVLKTLARLRIHSIEQPIKAGNRLEMADLCRVSPCPIALDEELIGVTRLEEKEKLVKEIKPQYIILKPALVGGFRGSMEWIELAERYKIGWWVTSALESNIGLNAIAQFTANLGVEMPQGLGTGALYTNNIQSDLHIVGDKLFKKC